MYRIKETSSTGKGLCIKPKFTILTLGIFDNVFVSVVLSKRPENSYFSPLFVEHYVLNDITTFLFKPQFYLRLWAVMIFDMFLLVHINMKKIFKNKKNYFASYNVWYLLRTEKSSPLHFFDLNNGREMTMCLDMCAFCFKNI